MVKPERQKKESANELTHRDLSAEKAAIVLHRADRFAIHNPDLHEAGSRDNRFLIASTSKLSSRHRGILTSFAGHILRY